MTPRVIADHVAVREHLPLDRAVRVELRDVLADLEERRGHVQPSELVDEVLGGRLPPRAVVERERDVVDVAGTVNTQSGPAGDAADERGACGASAASAMPETASSTSSRRHRRGAAAGT